MTTPDATPTPVHDAAERRARNYSWESFRAGNFLAIRHGANSERVLAPLAAQLAAALIAERPDLGVPMYRFAVSAWARAETLAMLLFSAIDGGSIGAPAKSILTEHRAAERRAAEERRNLGLDPGSHARLMKERADVARDLVDLDAIRARGREGFDARVVEAVSHDPARITEGS